MKEMLNEELQLLKQMAEEFSEREIDPSALKIELEGIPRGILSSLAEKGFLGALATPEYGGAGLDEKGYNVLLEVLAKHSPSVAMYVFLQNSLFIRPILKYGKGEVAADVIPGVASGRVSGSIVNCRLSGDRVSLNGRSIDGRVGLVPNSDAGMLLVLAGSGNESRLALVEGGYSIVEDSRKLGFRGLRFSSLSFSNAAVKHILIDGDGEAAVNDIYMESSANISAMALGMSEAALDRAVSYAKERQAFGERLIEFQPIAFKLARLASEFNIYENYLHGISSVKEGMELKALSIEFSRNVSRASLQVHGGYGYIEDSGIERFYRDTMALELLTGDYTADMTALSRELFGEGSAKY
ncbi:MAG: acyl-CoA dehydrogenase family protein [Nitrososphaerota archaeon]|nr:acyl-CoA dehydrogenase family protein [Nitrososphaerota archaeon]